MWASQKGDGGVHLDFAFGTLNVSVSQSLEQCYFFRRVYSFSREGLKLPGAISLAIFLEQVEESCMVVWGWSSPVYRIPLNLYSALCPPGPGSPS